jgi:TPR repeat protein
MAAMRPFILAAGLVALAAHPARAQFYDLDGTYRCVTTPDDSCAKSESDAPAPALPLAREQDDAPSFAEAIEHVKKRAPSEADMRVLAARAEAKDARAVEVMAWCKLNGIGTKANALDAFWLYHEAEQLGVANAKRNETAIFERRLTSAQRQEVLTKESAK